MAVVAVAVVAVAVVYVVAPGEIVASRIANTLSLAPGSVDALSIVERFHNWGATLREWNSYIVVGIGFGRFEDYFGFLTPDNLYLELLVTTGLLGLISFLGLVRALARTALALNAPPPTAIPFRAAYLASLLALLTVSLTGAVMLAPRVSGAFWLLTGILLKFYEWHSQVELAHREALLDREARPSGRSV
jgi:O-antigen ligase